MIFPIWFSKFWDVLPAFMCARAIGNLWSICVRDNIFNLSSYVSLIRNIPFFKALKINSRPFLSLASIILGLDL